MAACLDRVSNGRFILGIGAGWNVEEMANHGVAFKDRWKVTRERVLAMREIWTKDVAEFHGEFVDFDPLWCWPKPVQAGGPPVLMGAGSKWTAKRIAEYCDGWIPVDGPYNLARGVEALQEEAARVGRPMEAFDLSVVTGYALAGVKGDDSRVRELTQIGFKRILFLVEPGAPDRQWPVLEQLAGLISQFR
jgi:alkanesulfonate monooxygenase SsuD/methylene tetrahydromethanopterin reductase-like flavin-dependent oxidoreductase (luciferase family)